MYGEAGWVKGVGIQPKMITIVMPRVSVHALYKPRNAQFTLPTVGHIVIGNYNNHSTS